MSLEVKFSSQRIKDEYLKIIDDKIEKYDDELNEVSGIDPEWYTPDMMQELLNFCKSNRNFLDTMESIMFKTAEELNTTIHLLTKDENGKFIPFYYSIYPLEYTSLSTIKKEYFRINPYLTFDEFLEGLIWESENPEEVLSHFERVIFRGSNSNYNRSDYHQEFWNMKIQKWIDEDRQVLQNIYSRQLDLLMVSIHPDIKRNYMRNTFETKSRELEFSVLDNSKSITSSVYDKFIFCNPTEQVPFIKISLNSDTQGEDVYKVFTRVSRSAINEWISKDEKLDEESPFQNEDYIFFLIKMENETEDSLVSLNIPLYAECYLSETKLSIKVPSAYSTEAIQTLTQDIVQNLFNVDIFDLKENSVEIETIIDNFPHIELVYLQFYLASNAESSIYIKETNGEISSKTRKVRMYYKPLSESTADLEDYMIEYETSNTKKILIKGPTQELSINFFVNIFGRAIKAFFLRQNAIKIMAHKVIIGEDFSIEKLEEKRSKKKKKSTTSDPHLLTKKGKIELLKSIVELPPNYSSYCQCRRQPIILTDEEAEAWTAAGETIFDKINQKQVKKEIKTFTLEDGRRLNFTCPSAEYPDIHLTKEPKDSKDKLYHLSPCCWDKKRKESIELTNIVVASGDNISVVSSSEKSSGKKNKIYSEDNLGEDEIKDQIFLPQELAQLLSFFTGEEGYNLLHPSKKASTSTFLECILIALRESLNNIKEYRSIIMDNTDPMVVAQEALGIEQSPENVHKDIGNIFKVLDSKLHYRVFEEYFKINIYVFELGNQDLNNPLIEADFDLEIPYHKIFSARTLRRSRPTIILIRYRNSSEYSLIVDSKNRGKFGSDMTVKMMDFFVNLHEVSSQKSSSTIRNLFSRINWSSFFKTDPIKAQEIDISGKARIVQLKSGLTIAIPPTQPFNVPLISKYFETPIEEVKKIFGEPDSWDDKGVWYSVMKNPNLMYVLTGYHGMMIPDNHNLPLNPFVPKIRQDIEFSKYKSMKRSVFALIQILHWAWRLENRPDFKSWIKKYISIVSVPEDVFELTPTSIHATFPKVYSVKEGFQEINRWWPEMFTPDGRITLWNSLYQRILQFFERESLVIEKSKIDPPQYRLIGFYDNPDDYPPMINVRIFINKESFKNWSRIDRKREENPKLSIHILNSEESISILASKETPTRVLFKDHWITVYNLTQNDYNTASKTSYNWFKHRKLTANYLPAIPTNFEIIILSFSKKFHIIETEIIKSQDPNPKRLHVLRYPDNTYAAILG